MTPEDEARAATVVQKLRAGERPTIEKPTVPEVLPVLDAYYRIPGKGNGGAVHIITEDFNTAQHHADWCLDWSLTPNGYHESDADVFMAWLLAQCSSTQRGKLAGSKTYPYMHGEDPETLHSFWLAADAFTVDHSESISSLAG